MKRKPANVERGPVLANNVAAEDRYARELVKLTREMGEAVKREVVAAMRSDVATEFFAMDASLTDKAEGVMARLTARFSKLFIERAGKLAQSMVNNASNLSQGNLSAAMSSLMRKTGLSVPKFTGQTGDVFKASVQENVGLIKSIPEQYLKKVNGAVMRSIQTGTGLQDLVPALTKLNGENERRARNIAKDQTRKAYNSLNRARMLAIGVKKYEWVHSGGSNEPRKLHVSYNGRVFDLDDPPVIDERTGERGIPGQAPNCGCTMRPIISFDDDDE